MLHHPSANAGFTHVYKPLMKLPNRNPSTERPGSLVEFMSTCKCSMAAELPRLKIKFPTELAGRSGLLKKRMKLHMPQFFGHPKDCLKGETGLIIGEGSDSLRLVPGRPYQ